MTRHFRNISFCLLASGLILGASVAALKIRDGILASKVRKSGVEVVLNGEVSPDLLAAHFVGSTGKKHEAFDDYSKRLAKTLGRLSESERDEVLGN